MLMALAVNVGVMLFLFVFAALFAGCVWHGNKKFANNQSEHQLHKEQQGLPRAA